MKKNDTVNTSLVREVEGKDSLLQFRTSLAWMEKNKLGNALTFCLRPKVFEGKNIFSMMRSFVQGSAFPQYFRPHPVDFHTFGAGKNGVGKEWRLVKG